MAVLYEPGENHTEFSVGKERFKPAPVYQGPGPIGTSVVRPITQPTTLRRSRRLKSGCPSRASFSPPVGEPPRRRTSRSRRCSEIQSQSPTGELLRRRAQFDLAGRPSRSSPATDRRAIWGMTTRARPTCGRDTTPIAVARSFVAVEAAPARPAASDSYQGFNVGTDLGPATPSPIPPTARAAARRHHPLPARQRRVRLLDHAHLRHRHQPARHPEQRARLRLRHVPRAALDALDNGSQDVTSATRFTALTPRTSRATRGRTSTSRRSQSWTRVSTTALPAARGQRPSSRDAGPRSRARTATRILIPQSRSPGPVAALSSSQGSTGS